MLKKIILFIVFIWLLVSSSSVLAWSIETPNLEKVYSKFIFKLERKLKWNKEISFLNKLNTKLYQIRFKKKLSSKQKVLVDEIIKLTNEKLFSLKYNLEVSNYKKDLTKYELSKLFNIKSSNKNNLFLENGVWYYYKFWAHLFFPLWSKVTEKDLAFNNINSSNDLIFIKEDWNLGFATNYEKIKLINDDIIFWVTDKYDFLVELKDDKKILNYETDDLFKELKNKTLELTMWKSRDYKIKEIYNYVLNNVYYPLELDLGDKTIFSWIDTYKLWTWACEWYTKLFNYMAKFSWISDIEVIRWFVIDAQDFPRVWHAWIRIWDRYYDPTFDDPLWNSKALTFSEYNYFDLPKDLLYTNRYLYNKLPENLRTSSMDYRKDIINKNLSLLVDKYSSKDFNLLKVFKFKEKYDIKYNEKINLSNLDKIMPVYLVNDFAYNENGKNKVIKSLSYYGINDSNLEIVLNQIKFNLDWYYFYKWDIWNWNYEYRLAYNLVFN